MRRSEVLILAAVALIALSLWLFRTSTKKEGPFTTRTYRYFGRIVRIEFDMNGDDVPESAFRYAWLDPFVHPHQMPLQALYDDNQDGRWDLWVTPVSGDYSSALVRYEVDTDRDGKPDWHFTGNWPNKETYERIRARRGF